MPLNTAKPETPCPDCGNDQIFNAPQGLCPICLLRMAMEPPADSTDIDSPGGTPFLMDSHAAAHPHDKHVPDDDTVSSGTADELAPDNAVRVFGDYELLEEISRGGMGVVYKARQVRLNRKVALKMVRTGKFSSEADIHRLRAEAESAAQLDHPGIVPVFEIGEHEGLHFFTMAFVTGKPLSASLIDGPLPAAEAAGIVHTVALAVQYAHEQGVIHRDLKPGNILIDSAGLPRVADFGLAKRITTDSSMTVSGEVLGTPSFMPPEQARGDLSLIGPASDVYAMGAVLYACLTGAPPFRSASSMETLRQVTEQLPVAPRQLTPSIPRDLETICLKCLEKEPSRRYPSAVALADDLQRFLNGHSITVRPVSRLEQAWRWAVRRPDQLLSLAALLVLVCCGGLALSALQSHHARAETRIRVDSVIRQIQSAELTEVPHLIRTLFDFADLSQVRQILNERLQTAASPTAKLRLSLSDGIIRGQFDTDSWRSWLNLSLGDLAVIAPLTEPWLHQIRPQLEQEATATPADAQTAARQLRAVCLLFAESGTVDSPAEDHSDSTLNSPTLRRDRKLVAESINWNQLTAALLEELFQNPAEFKAAQELLKPAAEFLQLPLRNVILHEDITSAKRNLAISLQGELQGSSPAGIADLMCLVDSQTIRLVTRHADRLKNDLAPALLAELRRPPPDAPAFDEDADDEARTSQAAEFCRSQAGDAGRRAMAAAWLAYIGHAESVWPLLRAQTDPSIRYALQDRLRATGVPVTLFTNRLKSLIPETDSEATSLPAELLSSPAWKDPRVISEMHLLILISGEMLSIGPADGQRESLVRTLLFLLRSHPHPGIHSACEWSLKTMGAATRTSDLLSQLTPSPPAENRNWFVTSHGAALAVIRGPVTSQTGSEWTDPDRLAHRIVDPVTARVTRTDQEPMLTRIIDRDFAVGLKEVSFADFLLFDKSFHERIKQSTSTTVQHPANRINWYLAAEYCNWLSDREGIDRSEWCFQPNSEGNYAEGMTLSENYLQRTGYRMPTEVEWEYVCRAGTNTPRFFGHCRELMPQFVWFRDNSKEKALIVPGTLKPNDLGLFDVFGNVIEWCIDPYEGRPGPQAGTLPDHERGLTVDAEAWRVLRGGHLYAEENNIRASDLWTFRPLVADGHYGLRLARTLKDHRVSGTP